MRGGKTIRLYVPHAFDAEGSGATVASCPVKVGDAVEADDLIVELTSAHLDADIVSPVAGTLVRLVARRGESVAAGAVLAEVLTGRASTPSGAARTPGPRSGSAQYLAAHAAEACAVVLAAGAFVWPTAWLVGAAFAGLAGLAVRGLQLSAGPRGPADIVVVPLRLVANTLRQLGRNIVQIAPLLTALALAAFWLGLAIAVPAVIGGGTWLLFDGADGALAAARVAVLAHGYPLLSFVAAYVTLRRRLSKPDMLARLRQTADDVPEIALTGALVGGAAWLLLCAVILTPRPAWPAASLHSVVDALPRPISDPIDDGLATIARYEAQEVVDCLEEHGRGTWGTVTTGGEAGAVLVKLRASRAQPPDDGALAAMMVALQNELMGRVDAIQIVPPTSGARLRFSPIRSSRPVDDVASIPLMFETAAAERHLAGARSAGDEYADDALACSAAAF